MPTNRRRKLPQRRIRPDDLSFVTCYHMLYGQIMLTGAGYATREELAESWQVHRGWILPPYVELYPGWRPFACWLVDLIPQYGELRVLPGRENHPAVILHSRDDCPRNQFGILHAQTIPPIQETEATYLRRHGLLSAKEEAALAAGSTRYPYDGKSPDLWETSLKTIYDAKLNN